MDTRERSREAARTDPFMSPLLPRSRSRRSLGGRVLALVASVAVGIFFWHAPALYPLKLLAVMVHESGHALATLALGGSVQRVLLGGDESGMCLSTLPSSWLAEVVVSSAGYLGSLLAGFLLVGVAVRFEHPRAVLGGLALWLGGMAVLYAGNAFTFLFCAGMATALALAACFCPALLAETLDLFISAFIALYALFDLRDDLWRGAVRERSDAGILARATHVPALVWAALWSGAALVALALFMVLLWRSARGTFRDPRPAQSR